VIFLSFGAGVQSSVMLMLAIRGEIERPEHVIWADTGFEPRAVYRHVDWAEKHCAKARLPFHRVKAPQDLREQFHAFENGEKKYWNARPPLFAKASSGPMRRQCTRDVKINPINKAQLRLMGYKSARGVPPGSAVVQIGISTDEARRASPSRQAWIDRSYPLIDPLKMSRNDCRAWWESNLPHVSLPSSSCTICPFKTPRMWNEMRRVAPDDWAEAVEYDERIRAAYEAKTGQTLYLSNQRLPISKIAADQGSFELEDDIYCAGGCGL